MISAENQSEFFNTALVNPAIHGRLLRHERPATFFDGALAASFDAEL
jgi:hypothetical protein